MLRDIFQSWGRKSVFTALLFLACFFTHIQLWPVDRMMKPVNITVLKSNWQYRFGESPQNKDRQAVWVKESWDSPGWQVSQNNAIPNQNKSAVLWVRMLLPAVSYPDPALHFQTIDQFFSVYLDGALIYHHGNRNQMLSSFAWHILPLPSDYEGKTIVFKIQSTVDRIGFTKNIAEIGTRADIVSLIVSEDLDKIIFGFIFIFIGLAGIFLYFSRIKQPSFLAFGFFAVCLGAYVIARTQIKQIIFFNNYQFWGVVELLSLYIIPFFFNWYIRDILNTKRFGLVYWLWVVTAAYAVTMSAAALFYPNLLLIILPYYQISLLINMVLVILNSVYAAVKGNKNAVIVTIGVSILCLFASYDVFQEIRLIPRTIFITHWGLMLFLLCLAFILGKQLSQVYSRLQNYSKELEQKNTIVNQAHQEMESLISEIELTQKEVIFRLSEVAEARSKETGNHVRRVASYCEILARAYGLPEKEINILRLAAPMHDIGKLGIPDSILNKPGKLTPEEFEIIKSHTHIGYEMLKQSSREIFSAASLVAYQHHEKFNGTGYPNQLKGNEIHIFGRITAVADVFDSLASDRVYKKAWDLDSILELMDEEKNKHFDADLVTVLFDNLSQFVKIRDQFRDEYQV